MAWTFIYGHDADGNATRGEIDRLFGSIESGEPIRIAMLNTLGGKKKVHVFDGHPVMVAHDQVHAHLYLPASYNFIGDTDILTFNTPHFAFAMNVATSGKWKGRRIFIDGLHDNSDIEGRSAMNWFADI